MNRIVELFLCCVCVFLGFSIGQKSNSRKFEFDVVRRDTITRIDTMRVFIPPFNRVFFFNDTIYCHDTILIREQVKYQDERFTAYVSGYTPRLDSLILHTPTTIIKEKKKSRFHFGPSVGIGSSGAFIGVSLTYSMFDF